MHLILSLIFALLALPAWADTSKGLCVPYKECAPLVTKAVKGPTAIHLFWFVRGPRGTVLHQGFSCPLSVCNLATFTAKAQDVMTGKTTPKDAFTDVANFTCDYSSPLPVPGEVPICVERKDALVSNVNEWLEGIPEQVPYWEVKVNGVFPTRPAYTLTNGVRSKKEVARVDVGTPCDVSKPTLPSGSDLWAEYGTPGVVALCSKVTP